MIAVFEWAHRHFPNVLDCRPIFEREALRLRLAGQTPDGLASSAEKMA